MDTFTDSNGEPWLIVAEMARAEVDPRTAQHWARNRILARLELQPLRGGPNHDGFLNEDGSIDILENEPAVNGRRRPNPEAAAAKLTEQWYGRPPESILEVTTERHQHEWLSNLARLVELEIVPAEGRRKTKMVPLEFDAAEDVRLSSNEIGNQLFVVGQVDLSEETLKRLGVPESQWDREKIELGRVAAVTYYTAKHQSAHKPANFRHAFGEEGGEMPMLYWDVLNHELVFVGGSYVIEAPGIIN